MERKSIILSTEKQLKIYINPMRQRVLRQMTIVGVPVTAKKLADIMGITPSSTKHHLTQLEILGVVGKHHTELIHGITATFYEALPVEIQIGLDKTEFREERQTIASSLLATTYNGFLKDINEEVEKPSYLRDMLSGVIHLTELQAQELYSRIKKFTEENEIAKVGTIPIECALIFYSVGEKK